MKKIAAVMILVMAMVGVSSSQNVNWRSLGEGQRNVIQFNFGYDFGATAQVGYAHSFTIILSVLVGLDYSFPMGGVLLDDFKVRLGGQIEVVEIGGFSATVKIMSNLRRYQTQLVRIVSFGSDFAALAGYYRPTWYAAGEFGFDKSITSYLKHSDLMKAVFPAIKDGWYIPSGGHYYYGIQAGKTIGETFELSLRMGATRVQFDDEEAMLPYYAQLGLGVRF
jgi:hypothetical protein